MEKSKKLANWTLLLIVIGVVVTAITSKIMSALLVASAIDFKQSVIYAMSITFYDAVITCLWLAYFNSIKKCFGKSEPIGKYAFLGELAKILSLASFVIGFIFYPIQLKLAGGMEFEITKSMFVLSIGSKIFLWSSVILFALALFLLSTWMKKGSRVRLAALSAAIITVVAFIIKKAWTNTPVSNIAEYTEIAIYIWYLIEYARSNAFETAES